jgi:hypothetical protein
MNDALVVSGVMALKHPETAPLQYPAKLAERGARRYGRPPNV